MTLIGLSVSALLGLLAGISVGCIGIGGVILVPALLYIAGVPLHTAIPAAMAGYIWTGVVGTRVYLKHSTFNWSSSLPLWAGAIPAAVLGAVVTTRTPTSILELVIAALTVVSGIQNLLRRPSQEPFTKKEFNLPKPMGVAIGAATGFLSALTGTGGPAVLIPILFWLDVPVLLAIGAAQGIQLPISVLATISNAAAGTLHLVLALVLGASLSLGALLGAKLAHRLDQKILRRIAAIALLGTGLMMAGKIIHSL
jgi:uncharacterized membrane protein YfcA